MKYNQLGKTGILVSELCLGTMTFGGHGEWESVGKLQKEDVNKVIKYAFEKGINFFDTANAYSKGMSEKLLGESFKSLGINRQEIIVATKVRLRMGSGVNQVGLTRNHIIYSVDDSLERLGMSHIDLLYIHGVDPLTPIEETMRGLEEVTKSGKVRYLGISNYPAWMIMKANAFAEKMGWNKFEALQHYYTIANRDIEREIVPMALSEGLGLMPWSPLAGGFLSGKYRRDKEKVGNSRRDNFDFPPINKEKAYDIIDVMVKIGDKYKVSAARVALAWMLKKPSVTSIIIGAKNENQLMDNIASTKLMLNEDEMKELEAISELPSEYPGWMIDKQSTDRIFET